MKRWFKRRLTDYGGEDEEAEYRRRDYGDDELVLLLGQLEYQLIVVYVLRTVGVAAIAANVNVSVPPLVALAAIDGLLEVHHLQEQRILGGPSRGRRGRDPGPPQLLAHPAASPLRPTPRPGLVLRIIFQRHFSATASFHQLKCFV